MRPTRRTRAAKVKAVPYTLIPRDSDVGRPMYERLHMLIDEHHEELSQLNVRIALAWATAWKADVDGRVVLGKCKKASDLDRELAPYDFVILLNREFWQNPRVTDLQRSALMDHELMHAAIAYDEQGDPKHDERGRVVYRIRKHDLEEFCDIPARYGCWKSDIEAFARALARAEQKADWVGYSSLAELLEEIGVRVPIAVIAGWSIDERRDVRTWAILRQQADVKANVAMSPSTPACLAAAIEPVIANPAS